MARFLPGIRAEGLKPGKRTHVTIDAAAAYQHGHQFYRAGTGTWLTSHLPPQWIITPPASDNASQ